MDEDGKPTTFDILADHAPALLDLAEEFEIRGLTYLTTADPEFALRQQILTYLKTFAAMEKYTMDTGGWVTIGTVMATFEISLDKLLRIVIPPPADFAAVAFRAEPIPDSPARRNQRSHGRPRAAG